MMAMSVLMIRAILPAAVFLPTIPAFATTARLAPAAMSVAEEFVQER